jgi:hypothetical protein
MADVRVAKRYKVPGRELWERIGDPAKLAEWHPYIERTDSLDDGKTRVNTTVDGSRVTESILEQAERHHVFRIDDGPVPYDGFVSTVRVRDEGEDACIVEWEATLEPKGVPEDEAVEFTRRFFQAGLDAL